MFRLRISRCGPPSGGGGGVRASGVLEAIGPGV